MRDLNFFLDRYAPVSLSFMIVSMPMAQLLNHWLQWHRRCWNLEGHRVPATQINGPLSVKLDGLLPLDSYGRLMTETRDGRTAIFANFNRQDGSSDADYLAQTLGRERLRFVMMGKRKPNGAWQPSSTQFDWKHYGKKTDHWVGCKFRGVGVTKEDRWSWDEGGTPFAWEETEAYGAKLIKERFTVEMLERYAAHFGVDLFDPDYYTGRGVMVRLRPYPDPNDPKNAPFMAQIERYPNQ